MSPYNRPRRPREGIEVQLYSFFNLGTRWGGWSTPHPGRPLYPKERPGTPCIGGWGGPQGPSGQVRKISPPTGIPSPDRPAHSESLYRLRYPDSLRKQLLCRKGRLRIHVKKFGGWVVGGWGTYRAVSESKNYSRDWDGAQDDGAICGGTALEAGRSLVLFPMSFGQQYGPGFDSSSNRIEYQGYFLVGKGGRCLGSTNMPLSCAKI
jgi:hypothetical protein